MRPTTEVAFSHGAVSDLANVARECQIERQTVAAYVDVLEDLLLAFPIEVKNAGRVRPEDLRSLEAFAAEYPECVPLLVYRGRERLRVGRIWCVPAGSFLREIHPARSLTSWLEG